MRRDETSTVRERGRKQKSRWANATRGSAACSARAVCARWQVLPGRSRSRTLHESSVDGDGRPRDVAGPFRPEENDNVGELFRSCQTAQRNLIEWNGAAEFFQPLRGGESRTNIIHQNIVGRIFVRERLHKTANGRSDGIRKNKIRYRLKYRN